MAVLATQAPSATRPAPASKPAPMSVRVDASPKGGPAVEEWAKQMRTALEARKDEFRLATPKEKAEFVVRLDSVAPASAGNQLLAGALVRGEVNRPFTYTFTNVRTEAEKLARNLRGVADQMKAAGK